jgi:MSHA biogenesis protein MshN
MGFFKMSLINQMLQDLDARSSDGTGTFAIHPQVRAVPERRRIHPAWWAVLVLAILLIAVVSWLWLREATPTSPTAPLIAPPRLSLKIVPDLSAVQSKTQQNQGGVSNESVAVPISELPTMVVKKDEIKAAADIPPNEDIPIKGVNEPARTAAPTKSAMPSAGTIAMKSIAPVAIEPKKSMPQEPAKAPDTSAAMNINKQVKELTQQQRAENEYRKATVLMQQGRTSESIIGLEQTLQLDSLHASARQTLVGLLLEGKRQEEAIRKLRDGLSLDPAQGGMAMILARLEVERGELGPAVETLQRTLPYAVERADYQAFFAALLQRQARHKDAIEHYLIALRKTPQNGVWWMGVGISLQAENRLAEAKEAFSRAKSTNVLSPELQAFVEQKLSQLPR